MRDEGGKESDGVQTESYRRVTEVLAQAGPGPAPNTDSAIGEKLRNAVRGEINRTRRMSAKGGKRGVNEENGLLRRNRLRMVPALPASSFPPLGLLDSLYLCICFWKS